MRISEADWRVCCEMGEGFCPRCDDWTGECYHEPDACGVEYPGYRCAECGGPTEGAETALMRDRFEFTDTDAGESLYVW